VLRDDDTGCGLEKTALPARKEIMMNGRNEFARTNGSDTLIASAAAGRIERPDRTPTLSRDLQLCSRPEPADAGPQLGEGSIDRAWALDRLVVGSRRSVAAAVVVAVEEERALHL